jgi:hypothetical protein
MSDGDQMLLFCNISLLKTVPVHRILLVYSLHVNGAAT